MNENPPQAIDVARVYEEIRAEVTRKRAEGLYPPEIEAEIDSTAGIEAWGDRETLTRAISQLRQASSFTSVVSTDSSKPYVAPALSGIKRVIQRTTQWYISAILDQLRIFAEMTIRTSKLLADRSTQLESRINAIEAELSRLQGRD